MDEKICIDSDVAIEVLKNSAKGNQFLSQIHDKLVFVTVISVFELSQRKTNLAAVNEFLSRMGILDLTQASAQKAAQLDLDLKQNGRMVDFRDLFIASIAMTNNCPLATLNKKHFKHISGLDLFDM